MAYTDSTGYICVCRGSAAAQQAAMHLPCQAMQPHSAACAAKALRDPLQALARTSTFAGGLRFCLQGRRRRDESFDRTFYLARRQQHRSLRTGCSSLISVSTSETRLPLDFRGRDTRTQRRTGNGQAFADSLRGDPGRTYNCSTTSAQGERDRHLEYAYGRCS